MKLAEFEQIPETDKNEVTMREKALEAIESTALYALVALHMCDTDMVTVDVYPNGIVDIGSEENDYLFYELDMFPYVRQRIFLHISAIFFGGISLGELENAWFGNPSAEFLRETRVVRGPNYPLY